MRKKLEEKPIDLVKNQVVLKNQLPRADIQFLRALAVLVVIAYHFKIPGFGGGFVGVDIFFVISGYLIFGQIHTQLALNKFSLIRFFEARIRRIFPALAVMCFATALWGWYFVLPRDYVAFSRAVLRSLCFVSNTSPIGAKDYFGPAADTKLLLHTWSLSVEGQFYFWLPLLLIGLVKAGRNRFMQPLLLLALASFLFALYLCYKTPDSGFYSMLARAWEFIAGAIVAILEVRQHKYTKVILLVCMLGVAISVSQLDRAILWPGVWTLLPVSCTALFIYFAVNEQNNPVFVQAMIQRIGDMSYSLYLWHWPVWVCARQLYNNSISNAGKAALLVLIYVLAYLSWRWVELPLRNRLRVTSKQMLFVVLGTMLCAILFLAYIITHKGAPKRFPEYVSRASIQGHMGYSLGKCQRNSLNEKDYSEQFCVYGASNKINDATLMIWGDSHASQYLSPLISASAPLKITGLIATMSGCRSFIETDAIQYTDYPHCKDFNREVFAYLSKHPHVHTIVLGRIWFDSAETIDRTVLLVQQLIKQGHQVILLTPLPLPGMHVENEWAMSQIRAGHAINEIKLVATAEVKQANILVQLRKQLKQELATGKLYLIDPTEELCDVQSCYVVREGVANFRDISHLSELASRQMQPSFKAALTWAAQTP